MLKKTMGWKTCKKPDTGMKKPAAGIKNQTCKNPAT